MNNVNIIGNLTRDAELKYIGHNNTPLLKFSIAVNKYNRSTQENEPHYFDVSFWGKGAPNIAKYMTKGQKVGVSGELTQDRWEQDGHKRSKVYITTFNIVLCGGGENKPQQREPEPPKPVSHPQKATDTDFDDDIPF